MSLSAAYRAAAADVEKKRHARDRAERAFRDAIVTMETAKALARACERPCLRCGAGADEPCVGDEHRRVSRPGDDVRNYCPRHDFGLHSAECDRRYIGADADAGTATEPLAAGTVSRLLANHGFRRANGGRRGRIGFKAFHPLADDGQRRDRDVVHVQAPAADLDGIVEALTAEGLTAASRPGLVPVVIVTRGTTI